MKQLYFITTNEVKFRRFTDSMRLDGFEVVQLKEETPEIQAANNREVAEFSAEWAANRFQCAVIKEDVGLYIDALKGFPGPYLGPVEKQLETEGFLRLLSGTSERQACWEYAIAYCEPGQTPRSFSTKPTGTISPEARGVAGWYADKLFIPDGQTKTIAQLLDAGAYVRDEQHYTALKEYLNNKA